MVAVYVRTQRGRLLLYVPFKHEVVQDYPICYTAALPAISKHVPNQSGVLTLQKGLTADSPWTSIDPHPNNEYHVVRRLRVSQPAVAPTCTMSKNDTTAANSRSYIVIRTYDNIATP